MFTSVIKVSKTGLGHAQAKILGQAQKMLTLLEFCLVHAYEKNLIRPKKLYRGKKNLKSKIVIFGAHLIYTSTTGIV